VCDVVLMQCKERFKFRGHLIVAKLIEPHDFDEFIKRFPQNLLDETVRYYPQLDKERIES